MENLNGHAFHVRSKDPRFSSAAFEGYKPMMCVSSLNLMGKLVAQYSSDEIEDHLLQILLPLIQMVIIF